MFFKKFPNSFLGSDAVAVLSRSQSRAAALESAQRLFEAGLLVCVAPQARFSEAGVFRLADDETTAPVARGTVLHVNFADGTEKKIEVEKGCLLYTSRCV